MVLKILFIDKDAYFISQLLADWQGYEYEARTAVNANQAIEQLLSFCPDIIISEYMLPNTSFKELMKRLRCLVDTPVVVLSNRQEELAVLNALQYGAEDFIRKDACGAKELFFRLLKLWKNYRQQQGEAEMTAFLPDSIQIADILINRNNCEVKKTDKLVFLSAIEYKLLLLLADNQNKIVTLAKISSNLFADKETEQIKSLLYTYFSNIRRKLGLNNTGQVKIKCISREGYCLVTK